MFEQNELGYKTNTVVTFCALVYMFVFRILPINWCKENNFIFCCSPAFQRSWFCLLKKPIFIIKSTSNKQIWCLRSHFLFRIISEGPLQFLNAFLSYKTNNYKLFCFNKLCYIKNAILFDWIEKTKNNELFAYVDVGYPHWNTCVFSVQMLLQYSFVLFYWSNNFFPHHLLS